MRITLHLAAALLLTTAASAQTASPAGDIGEPAPIHLHAHTSTHLDLQWLWQYTQPAPDGNEGALLVDKEFPILLHQTLNAPQSFWRDGKLPLADVAQLYFGTLSGWVHGEGNRYITFSGCVAHACENQGLLWVDTAVQHPTVVFAATEWTTQGKSVEDPNADFNLWLFTSRPLDPAHPPQSLVDAIANWNTIAPQHIKTALIIDPDGTPHQINPTTIGATPSKPPK